MTNYQSQNISRTPTLMTSPNNNFSSNRGNFGSNNRGNQGVDQSLLVKKLEREAAGLREMLKIKKMEKKRIIDKRRKMEEQRKEFMKKNPNSKLADIDGLTLLENQREELKNLKLNYNLLKEETDKQKQDLKKLIVQEDVLMAQPTTKDELTKQNKLLEEKVASMKRDFDRLLYEKTLIIEKKARAEMQKHAIKCALKFADQSDPEIAGLVKKLKKLEKENSKLERLTDQNSNFYNPDD